MFTILKWIAGKLIAAVILVAFIAGILMTYSVMKKIFPENLTMQVLSIAFFDVGAVAWLGAFVYIARGTSQRGISLIMFLIDLAGVGIMVTAEVMTGGQNFVNVPEWMGRAIINGTIFVMLANLIMGYFFHMSQPEVREAIHAQNLEDKFSEAAFEQAEHQVESQALEMGSILARRATARLKYRLALPMTKQEAAEFRNDVIDVQAVDYVPTNAFPRPEPRQGFWDGVKSFFTGRRSTGRYQESPAVNYNEPTKAPAPAPNSSNPEADQNQNPPTA